MSNNFYQAFNSISDSMTKTVPKEIKMTNEVVFTESTPLISKDIYRTYRHCRNIEISHLWQYSISPITFIVFCLSAYGYLPLYRYAINVTIFYQNISEDTLNTYWKFTSCGAIFLSLT